ncbi:hypothetical protein N9059_01095 [bacterium]|nr:hypothetical protein [bacterium]
MNRLGLAGAIVSGVQALLVLFLSIAAQSPVLHQMVHVHGDAGAHSHESSKASVGHQHHHGRSGDHQHHHHPEPLDSEDGAGCTICMFADGVVDTSFSFYTYSEVHLYPVFLVVVQDRVVDCKASIRLQPERGPPVFPEVLSMIG